MSNGDGFRPRRPGERESGWDDLFPDKPPFPPRKTRDSVRDDLLRRIRDMKRKCHACGEQVPAYHAETGARYRFCPLCGANYDSDASLDSIKFLLEELNSKLGKHLEDIRRQELSKVKK